MCVCLGCVWKPLLPSSSPKERISRSVSKLRLHSRKSLYKFSWHSVEPAVEESRMRLSQINYCYCPYKTGHNKEYPLRHCTAIQPQPFKFHIPCACSNVVTDFAPYLTALKVEGQFILIMVLSSLSLFVSILGNFSPPT